LVGWQIGTAGYWPPELAIYYLELQGIDPPESKLRPQENATPPSKDVPLNSGMQAPVQKKIYEGPVNPNHLITRVVEQPKM
jgi:hypothetical protein